MKTLWLLLVIAIPLQFIHAQEVKHAPTVEQCRADQRLWLSKLEESPMRVRIPMGELDGWLVELNECRSVDPTSEVPLSQLVTNEIIAEQATRYWHFIQRHNLYNQFLAEDAQGKR